MKRLRVPLRTVSVCLLLVTLACRGRPGEEETSIQKRLDEKGTIDLMDQVSKAPEYQPPADGRLTERQVEIYLDVRRREQKIRGVALQNLKAKENQPAAEKRDVGFFEALKAMGDLADVATADLRAAQELGHNPKEYSWIRERVLEAQMLQTTKALNQQVARGQQALLARLDEQKRAATDETQRAAIDRQIADLQKSAAGAAVGSDPAKEHNAGLLARYESELAKLRSDEQRLAAGPRKGSEGGQGGQ